MKNLFQLLRPTLAGGRWVPVLGLALTLALGGCKVMQTAVNAPGEAVRAITPGQKGKPTANPVEGQQALLRFADEYAMRMVSGVDGLRRGSNALARAETLQTKIALASETFFIASGPNALANLLDMTIFVTGTRMALEDHFLPTVFGESARPMLEFSRNAEPQIWRLAESVLTPEQTAELRQTIETWHRQNPLRDSVVAKRVFGFAAQVAGASQANAPRPGSVFSLLNVDPLADMEPAVRELAQTRLFAERALFVSQKLPLLLRWQTELLTVNAVELPAVAQLVTNSTQIAAAVERFATVAEKLPGQIKVEREETLKALEAQESKLTPLVNEVRQSLAAGSQMSTSLNTTITTFDALMKRFGVGEPSTNAPSDTNSPPFNILDYARTAEQLTVLAAQLDALIKDAGSTLDSPALDKRLRDLNAVSERARADAKSVLNHAFLLGAGLILLSFACALTYRRIVSRGSSL